MKHKKTSITKKCSNLDMFGTPIMLTFQGENKFKTTIGAFLTLACIITIGGFAINGLLQVGQNKMISFSSETFYTNTDSVGALGLNLNQFNFNAAIGFAQRKLDPTYGSIQAVIVNQTSIFDNNTSSMKVVIQETPIEVSDCSQSISKWSQYFRIDSVAPDNQQSASKQYERVLQNIQCLKLPDFSLQGKQTSLLFQYVRIQLLPCAGVGCKTSSQIEAYFQNQALRFMFNDYYFKLSDESPVQSYINDQNFVTLQPTQEQVMSLYIQKSHIESSFLFKNTSQDLYQMGEIEKSSKLRNNSQQPFATFYLRLDDMQILNQRKNFGLLDWIGSIGGIARTLTFFFEITALIFSYQLFISTVLKNLFFVKKSLFGAGDMQGRSASLSRFDPNWSPDEEVKSSQLWSQGNFIADLFSKQITGLKKQKTKNLTIDEGEYTQYKDLKQDIKDDEVSQKSIQSIVLNIWTKRARFGGILGNWAFLKFYLLGFCKCCLRKDRSNRRLYTTYLNGIRKFNKQLDVISLLRSVRLSKILYHTSLNTRQSILMQFQRSNLVESTDNTQESDYLDLVKDLNHKKQMVRLFSIGKINRVLKDFSSQQSLSVIDTHLLKGFYTNAKLELEAKPNPAIVSSLKKSSRSQSKHENQHNPITPFELVTPEKNIDVSVNSRADKPTTSSRKVRKVTISKETYLRNEFTPPSPQVKSPEGEKVATNIEQTERSLFQADRSKLNQKPRLQEISKKP